MNEYIDHLRLGEIPAPKRRVSTTNIEEIKVEEIATTESGNQY